MKLQAMFGVRAADARRGVVHLNPLTLASLGAASGDALLLSAGRDSLFCAVENEAVPVGSARLDDLGFSNLRTPAGSFISAKLHKVEAFKEVVLDVGANGAWVHPDWVAELLNSKVATIGDKLSLVPMDRTPQNKDARDSISKVLGLGWTAHELTVASADRKSGFFNEDTRILFKDDPQPPVSARGSKRANLTTLPTNPSLTSVSAIDRAFKQQFAAKRGQGFHDTLNQSAVPLLEESLSLEDMPALASQAHSLEELLELGLRSPEVLRSLGGSVNLGVILSGPRGSGKRSLARAVSSKLKLPLTELSGARLSALEPSVALNEMLGAFQASGSRVVLLSDAEKIFTSQSTPMSTVLVEKLPSILKAGDVALIVTTDKLGELDPLVKNGDSLSHSLVFPAPTSAQRLAMLNIMTRSVPLDGVSLDDVAERTPGFVAADLKSLCAAAAYSAVVRVRHEEGAAEALEQNAEISARVTAQDFTIALTRVKASALNGTSVEVAKVSLDEVRGIDSVKQTLTEAVLWPLSYPEAFARLGVPAPRGVLLYGPPGCGKTFVVKALAGSGKANIFSVKGSELLSKWVGDSELAVRDLFARARAASPSIIFLDEVDALAPARGDGTNAVSDRVVAALLTELDGVTELKNVVVVAATNRPELVDAALLRPGRIGRMVFVPPPDAKGRELILSGAAEKMPFDAVDWEAVAAGTENFSAADCSALIQEAGLTAMRESLEAVSITSAHLDAALKVVKPSLDPVMVEKLRLYSETR